MSEHELAVISHLTDEEKLDIIRGVEKLFAMQDRPLDDEKKAGIVEALIDCQRPYVVIDAGLRRLMVEDLKKITLPAILAAVRDATVDVPIPRVNCDHCFGSGMVMMEDEKKYVFALACICSNGNRQRGGRAGLVRWNGESHQYNRGRRLDIPERFLIAK